MMKDYTICVGGTGHWGLWISPDGGDSWRLLRNPRAYECNVRSLVVYPDNPNRILGASDQGFYYSEDRGVNWQKMASPRDGIQIWSLAIDPVDPNTIFAGARPDAFRSRDGGRSWESLSLGVTNPCPIVGVPRTTNIIIDPRDHRTIWAGIEVDGVYKSLDGGDTWMHMPNLGPNPLYEDVHGMAIRPTQSGAVYVTGPIGVATSTDEGKSWSYHEFPRLRDGDPWSYCRGILLKVDNPNCIFVGQGDATRGITGALQRSQDGGKTWDTAPLPVEPNSVIYRFATHPKMPDLIVAATLYGYLYVSSDGGETWQKLKKEFGEIRSLALTPNC